MKLLVILVFSFPTISNALEFYKNEDDPGFMLVAGEFLKGDFDQFKKQVKSVQPHTVIFDSTGGIMYDSIQIGLFIRDSGLNTLIKNDAICYSACGYAFMGGVQREIEHGGKYAIHRPYLDRAVPGTFNKGYEDGISTALLVISYLRSMGLNSNYAISHLVTEDLIDIDTDLLAKLMVVTK